MREGSQDMHILTERRTSTAELPARATKGSAGLDMVADVVHRHPKYIEYDTGIAVAIPRGYVGLLFPRSSVTDRGMTLGNSVGVIDSDYRGTIRFRYYRNGTSHSQQYMAGDRVGQLVIMRLPDIEIVDIEEMEGELVVTDRGEGGFGSTRNNRSGVDKVDK